MRKKLRIIVLILLLLFIWGNSCLPQSASIQESGWVTELLRPILSRLIGAEHFTGHLVRKMAHFVEYAVLGCAMWLLVVCLPMKDAWRLPFSMVGTMLVALLDETSQIFSGRGPMIQDVWLDFAGATVGLLITGLIWQSRKKRKRNT